MNDRMLKVMLFIILMMASIMTSTFVLSGVDAADDLTIEVEYEEGIVRVAGVAPTKTDVINITIKTPSGSETPAFANIDRDKWTYSVEIRCTLTENSTVIVMAHRLNEAPIRKEVDLIITPSVVEVTSVVIHETLKHVSLYVDETKTIKAEVSPSNATDPTLKWTSNNHKVATVDDAGVVTAIAAGNAIITVTAGEKTDTCNVVVYNRPVVEPTYTFTLSIDFYTDDILLGSSGYTLSDLKEGITLQAQGKDAGEALEMALNRNNIPNSFFSGGDSAGNDLKHWVGHIFGMGDKKYENGAWIYWIQYHNGSYNQKTLGYYKDGGSFSLVYGITSSDTDIGRIRPVEIPSIVMAYTGSNITISDTSSYEVISGGTGKEIGVYDAILRLKGGYAWEDATFTDKTIKWVISDGYSPIDPEQPHTHTWDDGVITKQPTCTEPGVKIYTCSCGETRTEIIPAGHNWSDWYIVKQATEDEEGLKERTCSISGEKETQPIPKIVIVTNDDGTQTRIHVEVDGTVVSTTTGAKDGSTKVEKMKEDTDKDGNKVTMSSTEIIDKDGNSKTSSTHTVKDADGKEIYSKNEELTKKNHLDNDGNHVTTTSSTSVENKNGKRIETESESTITVATDGNKKTEIVIVETTTNADGSIESKTVRENIKESPKGDSESTKVTVKEDSDSRLNATEIKIKDKDGKTSIEKKVEIESKDGNVKSIVEIPDGADKADIITTVTTDSNDGNHAVTKEQIEQAIAIQGKVSDEIKDDVKDHSKVIQIVSSTPDASLTVPKDAIKAASDANSSLRIVSEKGSIAASDTVLSNMLVEEEITISISEAKDEHINDAQREIIPDGAFVVDVRIMAGDKDLGKSLGGLITISIRYTPADGKIGVAYHIDDDGNKVRMGGIYDPIKGEIVFDSTHCSLYMVVDEDPSKSGLSNATIFVGIAVAVVAAIAVAIMLYVRKR